MSNNPYSQWIGFIGLGHILFQVLFILLNLSDLPEQIPTHFNASGKADGYGSPSTLWMFPMLTFFISILLGVIASGSTFFTLKEPETEAAAEKIGALARKLLLYLSFIVSGIFSFATLHIISTAKGIDLVPKPFILPVLLVLILVPVGWFVWKVNRLKKE